MKVSRRFIKWKKFVFCLSLFLFLIFWGCFVHYYYHLDSSIIFVFSFIGFVISSIYIDKYAVKRVYKILETITYKNEIFNVELEYYYDVQLKEFYVDVELGNNNLNKINDKYNELKSLE